MAITEELRRTVRKGRPAPERHHVADVPDSLRLIAGFSRHQQWRNLSPRTIEMRRSVLTNFSAYNSARLLWASPNEIETWLRSRKLAPRSVALYLEHLHNFYVWAIQEDVTDVDPTLRLAKPKYPRRLPRPIGDAALLAALRRATPKMAAMLALAAYEGLRCMEIARLEVDDVLGSRVPPLLVVRRGKGEKERVLPLAELAELALTAYGMPSFGPVFPKRNGKTYNEGTISTMINSHLRSCGLSETAHQLRHWFATAVFDRSQDLRMTQELMGHANPGTTAGYVAWSPLRAASVVRSLGIDTDFRRVATT